MGQFLELTGVLTSVSVNDRPPVEMTEGMARDAEFSLTNYVRTVLLWEPDLAALRAAGVLVAAGRASAGQLARRAAAGLAVALGTDLALFSGDHGGFASEAETFATELRKVLAG